MLRHGNGGLLPEISQSQDMQLCQKVCLTLRQDGAESVSMQSLLGRALAHSSKFCV